MPRSIKLNLGYVVTVDDTDFTSVAKYNWHVLRNRKKRYAARNIPRAEGGGTVLMHRELMGLAPGDPSIDHKDGDGLNNRRSNLRSCTQSQNLGNQGKHRGKSRYKGVSWHKANRKWQAQIGGRAHHKHLGYFEDEGVAASAYNSEAQKRFGDFAHLNIIEEVLDEQ